MWIRIEKPLLIPADVKQVLSQITDAGFEAYLVGGCVRDLLRTQTAVKDYDIATNANPDEVKKIFPAAIEVGKAFGVMKVQPHENRDIEVATFRKESDYRDHRHPSKVEFSDVEADAQRRDFTVNALYYDVKTAQVLDLVDGLKDLNDKVLRAVGDPSKRFKEDALRMLRAVRFAARFGLVIEEKTRTSIVEASGLIRNISIERVRDELEKMIVHSSCKKAMLELEELHLFENVLPEISVAKLGQKKVWDQTLRVLKNLSHYPSSEPMAFYWGALFLPTLRLYPIEKRETEARRIGERLKLSIECIDAFGYLARETPKFKDAFMMRQATLYRWMKDPSFELLMRFHELDAVSYDGNLAGLEFVKSIYPEAKRKFELRPLLSGDDLVKLGLSPGRQFTEILRAVEDLVLEGKLTTKEEAFDLVLKQFVK